MNIKLSKNGNRNNPNIHCSQKFILKIPNLVKSNQLFNQVDSALILGINLSKVNQEGECFNSNRQVTVCMVLKVRFSNKIKTKVPQDHFWVELINNLLLDPLFNNPLQAYLDKINLLKIVLCLVGQLNNLPKLNLAHYSEGLLSLNQRLTYFHKIILVPFLGKQIYKIIRLQDLEHKLRKANLDKVNLDSHREVFLEIPFRVVYFLKLLKLSHLLSQEIRLNSQHKAVYL